MKNVTVARLVASTFLVAASLTSANAADMALKAPPPPVINWSGCYFGGHIGVAWDDLRMTDVGNAGGTAFAAGGVAGQTFDLDNTSVIGGGQVGCNYQTGQFVFGLEGDLGGIGLHGALLDPHTASNTMVGIGSGLYGDITGRAGVAWGGALLYAKGGVAFYDGRQFFSTTSAAFISNSNVSTFVGYAAGAGVEWQLWSPNWSAKVEYLHFGFGTQTFNVLATGGTFPFRENLNVDTISVGLNYHFNWAPIASNY
jgi:outer membrane immunogenic protein